MLPWDQLSGVGAGGMIAVTILWVVFGFLNKRGNATKEALTATVSILERQTEILKGIHETTKDTRDKVIVIHERSVCVK